MMGKRKIRTALLAAGLGVLLAACSSGTAGGGATSPAATPTIPTDDISVGVAVDQAARALLPAAATAKGTLTVAMELKYPPTTFLAADGSTPVGFNPDMARLIAAKLGLKLDIANVGFDTIIPALQGGRYDMTVTSMSPSAARVQVVDMVDYFTSGSSIAVAAGNPDGYDAKNLCGKTVAVTQGSVQETTTLPALSKSECTDKGAASITATVLPNVQDAMVQVASGRIKAVYYDTPSLGWAAAQQPAAFQVLSPEVSSSVDSVAISRTSGITAAVQAAIQSILPMPQYQQALQRWGMTGLGITQAQLHKS